MHQIVGVNSAWGYTYSPALNKYNLLIWPATTTTSGAFRLASCI